MTNHTAEAMGLYRWHFFEEIYYDCPAYGCESVSIIKTKWGKFMALAANIQSLKQSELALAG